MFGILAFHGLIRGKEEDTALFWVIVWISVTYDCLIFKATFKKIIKVSWYVCKPQEYLGVFAQKATPEGAPLCRLMSL